MLHTNELPLRYLITELDGPTNSRDGFTEPIEKLLKRVNSIPLKDSFPQINNSVPLVDVPEDI